MFLLAVVDLVFLSSRGCLESQVLHRFLAFHAKKMSSSSIILIHFQVETFLNHRQNFGALFSGNLCCLCCFCSFWAWGACFTMPIGIIKENKRKGRQQKSHKDRCQRRSMQISSQFLLKATITLTSWGHVLLE